MTYQMIEWTTDKVKINDDNDNWVIIPVENVNALIAELQQLSRELKLGTDVEELFTFSPDGVAIKGVK